MIQWIIFIAYIAAGWWGVNKVWYSRRAYLVHDSNRFYIGKFLAAVFLGWLCIPIAIVMTVLGK